MLGPMNNGASRHLQLGEGLLLTDVDLDAILAGPAPLAALAVATADDARCLGATAAGCTLRCIPTTLHTEARGKRTPTDGTMIAAAWQVTLSGTLTAVSPENAARLLSLPAPAAGAHRTLAPAVGKPLTAPMTSLCWVGNLDQGLLAFSLTAPVSTGGLTLAVQRNGTGSMPFVFTAQQSEPSDGSLPLRMHWLKEATA